MNLRLICVVAVMLASGFSAGGQETSPSPAPAIAWYGTWEQGLRVAKGSGRPILLVAAAPQCHGTSGLW